MLARGTSSEVQRQLALSVIHLTSQAAIAQLGERQTEDLEVPGSIPGLGNFTV